MIIYKDEVFSGYNELFEKQKLYSLNYVMHKTGAGLKTIKRLLKKLDVKSEDVILKPSGKVLTLFTVENINKIIGYVQENYKDEEVPDNYITKKELALWLKVKEPVLKKMQDYFSDFNQYSKYFFRNNIKTKYFIFTEDAKKYYLDKKNSFHRKK